MAAAPRTTPTPVTAAARERLREQQRSEARLLAAVLAAQGRLDSEREKVRVVIARAQRGIDARQATLNERVHDLIATSGLTRTAILLDRPEHELARIARARCRPANQTARPTAKDGAPDVSA